MAQTQTTPAAAGEPPDAEHEVVVLSARKWRLMTDGDLDALAALLHDDAVFVHMGATLSKREELDAIRSGWIVPKRVDVEDVSVRFFGATAVLLNRVRLVAAVSGTEVTNPFVVTEVYVRRDAAWALASLSFTRLLTL